jgi:hypothetical protein
VIGPPPMSIEELRRNYTVAERQAMLAQGRSQIQRSDDRSEDLARRVQFDRDLELSLRADGVDPGRPLGHRKGRSCSR